MHRTHLEKFTMLPLVSFSAVISDLPPREYNILPDILTNEKKLANIHCFK